MTVAAPLRTRAFERAIVGADHRAGGGDAVALARALRPADVEQLTITGPPAPGLLRAADERGADVVVLGRCHRGLVGRTLLGDVTRRVLHGAACSVAVAPPGFRHRSPEIARVAVGFDDSPEAHAALRVGARLHEALGADLLVVETIGSLSATDLAPALVDWDAVLADQREAAEQRLCDAIASIGGTATGRIALGDARPTLTAVSAEVDVVVVGSRGRGALGRVVLGSTSDHLLHHAACPVVVVPPQAADGPAA